MRKTFDRAKQSMGEAVGTAAKTELDDGLKTTLIQLDSIRKSASVMVELMEKQLDLKGWIGTKNEAVSKFELMAAESEKIGKSLETGSKYKANMDAMNGGFKKLGETERAYKAEVKESFLTPFQKFLVDDIKYLDEHKGILDKYRLDMDSQKAKLKKQAGADDRAYQNATKAYEAQADLVKKAADNIMKDRVPTLVAALKAFAEIDAKFCTQRVSIMKNTAQAL